MEIKQLITVNKAFELLALCRDHLKTLQGAEAKPETRLALDFALMKVKDAVMCVHDLEKLVKKESAATRKGDPVPRTCDVCGETFTAEAGTLDTTCSVACSRILSRGISEQRGADALTLKDLL